VNLLYWLRGAPGKPFPSAVRCTCPDGVKTIALDRNVKRPFVQCVRAIETLNATRIEALDHDGNVLRATDIEIESPETDDADDRSTAPEPQGKAQSDLVLLSRLIADAYKAGAEQHREFADRAFERLTAITETAFARLDNLERAWTKTIVTQVKNASADAPEESSGGVKLEDLIAQFLPAFIASRTGASAAPAATSAANGVAGEAKEH
jgi:hypothetical protein